MTKQKRWKLSDWAWGLFAVGFLAFAEWLHVSDAEARPTPQLEGHSYQQPQPLWYTSPERRAG